MNPQTDAFTGAKRFKEAPLCSCLEGVALLKAAAQQLEMNTDITKRAGGLRQI